MDRVWRTTMGSDGRLTIPLELRDSIGLREGEDLILVPGSEGMLVTTRDRLRARVRRDLAGLDLTSELLTERRAASGHDT